MQSVFLRSNRAIISFPRISVLVPSVWPLAAIQLASLQLFALGMFRQKQLRRSRARRFSALIGMSRKLLYDVSMPLFDQSAHWRGDAAVPSTMLTSFLFAASGDIDVSCRCRRIPKSEGQAIVSIHQADTIGRSALPSLAHSRLAVSRCRLQEIRKFEDFCDELAGASRQDCAIDLSINQWSALCFP